MSDKQLIEHYTRMLEIYRDIKVASYGMHKDAGTITFINDMFEEVHKKLMALMEANTNE
jgi:hypothetical protein